MSGRREVFMGPRRRGSITHKVNAGEIWQGRRGKMRLKIWLTDQPTLEGERVAFSCRVYGTHESGHAVSVTDAIDRMETIYRERTLEHVPHRTPKDPRPAAGRDRKPGRSRRTRR